MMTIPRHPPVLKTDGLILRSHRHTYYGFFADFYAYDRSALLARRARAGVVVGAATLCLALASLAQAVPAGATGKRVLVYDLLPPVEEPQPETPPSCLLMSHDCEVCALDEGDHVVCSSTGIACEPTERRCYHVEEGGGAE